MSFFCSDHHLFIAGAPRVVTCPRCGSCSYEAGPEGGTCRACASGGTDIPGKTTIPAGDVTPQGK